MSEKAVSSSDNTLNEVAGAVAALPDYVTAYNRLNGAFVRFLYRQANQPGLRFGGAFAKTDYLLKEHHATPQLRQTINDARIRMRKQNDLSETTMQEHFLHDMKAVCLFIALVSEEEIPASLSSMFPPDRESKRTRRVVEYLRVVVNSLDDTCIYASADDETGEDIVIHYAGKSENSVYKDWDWSYVGSIVSEGTQLNIIRPREKDGVMYPELIIVEPDYLVDISSVASCFENYSHSPLVHLINKLRSSCSTSAMLLGNFSSQLLDETLRVQPSDRPYADSVKDFFRTNAVTLATTEVDKDFHQQAQQQKKNIRHTLMETLPQLLHSEGLEHIDSSEMMVEPSFFSEMLGLQGRMDFLQMDEKVLIEQKSGKGGYPQIDPETPREQQKHYVQLLLYMLLLRYNNRKQYDLNNHNIYCFLFYSRYANGLIQLGFAPQLVFEAIKVRNEITAAEFSYTHGGLNVLSSLTADAMNTLNARGKLWEHYQRPQLEDVLRPIHNATPLERAYYLRMLTFVETEHLMAKIGNQTKENSGFADKWHSSLEEKLLAGNIYCGLRMLSPTSDEMGNIETVKLLFEERPDNDISNFRSGDIVILYPYDAGKVPDARCTMVFRATIESIDDDTMTLHLRSAQAGGGVFWRHGERCWAIEHDFFESSYSALYKGLHSFLSAPQERRDLILCQREAQCDKSATLNGNYGTFNELALRVKQAKDLFLIIGPPGTGKTSYGMLNTLCEELLTPGSSVLLMSYTNRAVDEICSKLYEKNIDFIRIGSRLACEERYRSHLLEERALACRNTEELRQMIAGVRVVAGTTTSLNASRAIFSLRSFSLAIIDEASQILEPHLTGLLSAVGADETCAIKKIVMIGDHKQLPAVVQQSEEESRVDDPLLHAIHLKNCRLSLFERFLTHYGDNPDHVYMLTRQGRMHHDIALFPSRSFYENRLCEVPLPHQNIILPTHYDGDNGITQLLETRRVAFVNIDTPDGSPSDKVNRNEAQAIVATCVQIYFKERENFSPLTTLGVIVPYRNQIAEIRKGLEQTGIEPLRHITIDTVERYQGSQRDYILYGFTVQRYYQLEFLTANVFEEHGYLIDRKLNVAMTRARCHLLIFGNGRLIGVNPVFSKLIEYVRSAGCYIDVPQDKYLSGDFTLPQAIVS